MTDEVDGADEVQVDLDGADDGADGLEDEAEHDRFDHFDDRDCRGSLERWSSDMERGRSCVGRCQRWAALQ